MTTTKTNRAGIIAEAHKNLTGLEGLLSRYSNNEIDRRYAQRFFMDPCDLVACSSVRNYLRTLAEICARAPRDVASRARTAAFRICDGDTYAKRQLQYFDRHVARSR